MSFRPQNNSLMAAMAASMMGSSMPPQPYHQIQGLQPMAGLIPMQMMPPMPPGTIAPMGVTLPSGVTTISAPPVRNITIDSSQQPMLATGLQNNPLGAPPSLLGVYPGANAVRPPFTIFQQMAAANQDTTQQYRKPRPAPGSTITVFVGNITDRASDMLIRQLLSKCGSVNNWKRVQGANGKLQAFGFCEYCDQESALRAVRLLLNFEIADKKLVVKVDPKTQEKLDEYLKSKGISGTELDDATKEEDFIIGAQLQTVLKEHEIELSKEPDPKERQRRYNNDKRDPTKPENLSEMDLEDDKRSLIHREIDKFRDTYKKIEEKKEEEKKRKDEVKPKEEVEVKRERRSVERVRERSPERDRSRNSRRDNNRDRDREREREREREQRDRERDRERDRDRYRERDRDRRSEAKEPTPVEDEEEAHERRRLERQMKEKEASYQRRLREWEQRELRKNKDYDKDRQKEERRRAEEEDEKRKLKEFLEDYDDDRFDQKYYKGNSLLRRMRDREKEITGDENERQMEKKELDELREKLALEGHPDPDSEVRKRMMSSTEERDRNNKAVSDRIRALMLEARQKSGSVRTADEDLSLGSDITPKEETPVKTFGFAGMKLQNNLINNTNNSNTNVVNNGNEKAPNSQTSNTNSPDSMDITSIAPILTTGIEKRKKLSVSDVFNANEDEDLSKSKKRKLPTLIDDNTDSNLSTPTTKSTVGADNKTLTSDEKRKQIKALIEKIPTSKEELFKYEIDWSLVDNTLMERRIRPWINKKIAEYIGEEELALLDFICNKLQSKSSAQSILDDVAMVLDEEAEVFVVKMWRLLIYEIEAKKLGLGK